MKSKKRRHGLFLTVQSIFYRTYGFEIDDELRRHEHTLTCPGIVYDTFHPLLHFKGAKPGNGNGISCGKRFYDATHRCAYHALHVVSLISGTLGER